MKKSLSLFLLACLTSFAMNSQNGAQIEFKLSSSKGMNGTMKVFYSTPGSRMELNIVIPQMPGGGMTKTTIVKSEKPTTVYMLDDKNKTYMASDVQPSSAGSTENITVKVIGKEKVGNYNCTHAVVTKGTESSDYWTTTEIADYEKYNKYSKSTKFGGSDAEQAALAKNNAGGFIVKSVTKDPRGSDITMELVKYEKKDIAASQFQIPADYKASVGGVPTAPTIDATKLQNMTPEEREKYIEELKKQYGTQGGK